MQTEQRRVFPFVTEHALIERINRSLIWQARRLIKSRGARQKQELGDWFILDLSTHSDPLGYRILRGIRDLEALGRELGCLASWDGVVRLRRDGSVDGATTQVAVVEE